MNGALFIRYAEGQWHDPVHENQGHDAAGKRYQETNEGDQRGQDTGDPGGYGGQGYGRKCTGKVAVALEHAGQKIEHEYRDGETKGCHHQTPEEGSEDIAVVA